MNNYSFSIYEASDYAGIEVPAKRIKLYYGYEAKDAEGNNCFDASFPGHGIRIPFPVLKKANDSLDQWECVPCLMTGIAILIERGELRR
jgi:hypothetical protein